MGFFPRRKEPGADPVAERLAAAREATIAAGEPSITELFQQLDVPFQRKGDAWLAEVGGGWATFGWVPRDATLVGFLEYAEAPALTTELLRANAEPDWPGTSPTATN